MNEFYLGALNLSGEVASIHYTGHLRIDVMFYLLDTAFWEALKDLSLEATGQIVYKENTVHERRYIRHVSLYIQYEGRCFAGDCTFEIYGRYRLRIRLREGTFFPKGAENFLAEESIIFGTKDPMQDPYTSKERNRWKA